MLKSSVVSKLYTRFVWRDVTDRGVLPIGWSQGISIATDHLRIRCDPAPNFLGNGTHGIHVMAISNEACLLTRQYTDARQDDFAIAASLNQVATMLLMGTSYKVGVATNGLLDRLEKRGLLKQTQVSGRV